MIKKLKKQSTYLKYVPTGRKDHHGLKQKKMEPVHVNCRHICD